MNEVFVRLQKLVEERAASLSDIASRRIGPVPVEDTTTPVIEEPESPIVQTTPMRDSHPVVQEPDSVGEAPKKSYASIVSF